MKITIDEDVVKDLRTTGGKAISLSELLVCLVAKLGENPIHVAEGLIEKGVLLQDANSPEKLLLFQSYARLAESILLESDTSVPKVDSLDELVTILQSFFPRERKCDSFGTPKWSYRGNKRDIASRLQKFFKLYGDYPYDKVIEATKRYVARYELDRTYMKTLQYFIMKEGEPSELANELESLDEEEVPQSTNYIGEVLTA